MLQRRKSALFRQFKTTRHRTRGKAAVAHCSVMLRGCSGWRLFNIPRKGGLYEVAHLVLTIFHLDVLYSHASRYLRFFISIKLGRIWLVLLRLTISYWLQKSNMSEMCLMNISFRRFISNGPKIHGYPRYKYTRHAESKIYYSKWEEPRGSFVALNLAKVLWIA